MSVTKTKIRALTASLIMIAAATCAQAGILDVLEKVPGVPPIGTDDSQSAEQIVEGAIDEAIPMSEVQAKHACGFSGKDTAKLGPIALIRAKATRKGLEAASQALQIENIELPEEIQSPCYAEVRWNYVDRKSVFWAKKVAMAANKALEALDIDDQIEAARLFKDADDSTQVTSSEFVTMRKEIDRGLKLVEEGMSEKQAVNAALLAEASDAMRGALTYGAEIVGWDQRLIEFMSDNFSWSWNRKTRVAAFVEHARLVGGTFQSVSKVSQAMHASETDDIDANETAGEEEQPTDEEYAAFETMLAEELNL